MFYTSPVIISFFPPPWPQAVVVLARAKNGEGSELREHPDHSKIDLFVPTSQSREIDVVKYQERQEHHYTKQTSSRDMFFVYTPNRFHHWVLYLGAIDHLQAAELVKKGDPLAGSPDENAFTYALLSRRYVPRHVIHLCKDT